jgi:hypothetical protein
MCYDPINYKIGFNSKFYMDNVDKINYLYVKKK